MGLIWDSDGVWKWLPVAACVYSLRDSYAKCQTRITLKHLCFNNNNVILRMKALHFNPTHLYMQEQTKQRPERTQQYLQFSYVWSVKFSKYVTEALQFF